MGSNVQSLLVNIGVRQMSSYFLDIWMSLTLTMCQSFLLLFLRMSKISHVKSSKASV